MEISTEILRRHMADATVEQLAADYRERGYAVMPSGNGADTGVDLVVEGAGERIYFQVKSAPGSAADREALKKLRRYVSSQPNARLQLVLVRPPDQPSIDIPDIESLLYDLCMERIDQLAVSELATTVMPQGVMDVDFDLVKVTRDNIEVQGTALAEFDLEYGGSGDDGMAVSDSYPLKFHLHLNHQLEVEEVEELSVDVSSFYE